MKKRILTGLFVCGFVFQAQSMEQSWFNETQCSLEEGSGTPSALAVIASATMVVLDYCIIKLMAEK